jgi:anti-sigma B factor antagonist
MVAPMPPLEIKTEQRPDRLHVGLNGELDIVNAPSLDAELVALQADSVELVLDLRGVTFIDSTGLRALLAADERARSGGGRVVVVRGAAAVDRAFAVTQLDQRLEVVDDPGSVGDRPISRGSRG